VAQRIGQHKILGVAIGETSLVVAEASRGGGSPPRVTQAATFAYPEGLSLQTPEPLGRALGAFLKSREFSARHAVIGVPARWVLSKAREVPAADPDLVAEALRLQVEGEFSQEIQNLVFDYAGETSPSDPRTVLLMAIQDSHLQQLKALAAGARLSLSAVTPVGSVLAAAAAGIAAGKPRSAMVVSVGPGGIELAAQDGSSPRVLRHLGSAATSPSVLAGELRRAAFLAGGSAINGKSVNGNGVNGNGAHANGNGHGPALIVWDDQTLTDPSRKALADAVGARLESGNLETLGVPAGLSAAPREAGGPSLAGAAALAVAALEEAPLPADFLHSRLAPPKALKLPGRSVLIAVAAVLVLGLGVLGYLDIQARQTRLDELTSQVDGEKPRLKEAEAFVKRVSYAQNWLQGQPRFLGCLLGLSQAIPDDYKTYIVNLTLKDNMKGVVNGKTSGGPQDVNAIVDRMNQSKHFNAVKPTQIDKREGARGAATEIAFTIEFVYVP